MRLTSASLAPASLILVFFLISFVKKLAAGRPGEGGAAVPKVNDFNPALENAARLLPSSALGSAAAVQLLRLFFSFLS